MLDGSAGGLERLGEPMGVQVPLKTIGELCGAGCYWPWSAVIDLVMEEASGIGHHILGEQAGLPDKGGELLAQFVELRSEQGLSREQLLQGARAAELGRQ